MRRVMSSVLLVLGGLFLFLAIPAGYLNRTVLDAPTFADRVDELRQLPEVSKVLGDEVTQQILAQNPDLVAVQPLVEVVATGVVGSDVLSGPVRLAAAQFHKALTTDDGGQLVLRIADVGAVVAGVLGAVAPEKAPAASQTATTLADIGSQQFAADIIRLVDLVDTLAWLLPLLALACLAGAVLVHPDRWDGLRRVGWTVLAVSGLLALIVVVGGVVVAQTGDDTPKAEAVADGVWEVFVRPIWLVIALVAAVGAILVLVGSGRAARWQTSSLTHWITDQPRTPTGVIVKALAFIAVGVAAVLEPEGMLTLGAVLVGVLLVVTGVGTLARTADQSRDPAIEEHHGRIPLLIAAGVGVAALLGLGIWAARSPDTEVAGAAEGSVTGTGDVCNGHAELCDRRFDEVSYPATHNSMSVAGKPGWFLGEQGRDIIPQLDSGVRGLLVDVWYGRDAGNGRVRTAARSYEEALQVANEELGPEVVDAALRVVDAVAPGEPEGPEALFMCHGLCETGATSFDTTLQDIRSWLATNPDEVLTIFVEDHVDAADVAASVEAAGLSDYLYTPVKGEPFPTLSEMIRSGQRLVVMLEEGDGRPEFPWLVNGFEFVQETPYTFPTVESFSCAPNRGDSDAPLLQINHWLASFSELVTSAQQVNVADVLGPRVQQCKEERGMQPNLVAVNYADIGDLLAVVDQLNGVG